MEGAMRMLALWWATMTSPAWASPETLSWQGRLTDSAGAPLEGSHAVTLSLWDAATGGNAVGSPIVATADAQDGFVSVELAGLAAHLTPDGRSLWLQVALGPTVLAPRHPVDAVPYAVVASRVLTTTTTATTCTEEGAIRWDGAVDALRVCDGSTWRFLAINNLGSSKVNPGRTCKALRDAGETSSGVYWIDPDLGSTDNAYQAYCDQELGGGGWTVCLRFDFNTTVGTRRFDGSQFRTTFGAASPPPGAYASNCTSALTALGDAANFDWYVRTHVVEANQWQWLGPVNVGAWRSVYDNTSCSAPTTGYGGPITQCAGSSAGPTALDVSSFGYKIGWHAATGGACDNGSDVNQFAAGTNNNVLLEMDFGYNYGHGLYMHFDCQPAVSHPCNGAGSGANNTMGTGAGRLLVGNAGAAGPDCGPYDKDFVITRPTVSFAFRER
jgi:hypothetical protein